SSRKGTGFVQPAKPHEHWHVDIAYVNCWGTFYYLFLVGHPIAPQYQSGALPQAHTRTFAHDAGAAGSRSAGPATASGTRWPMVRYASAGGASYARGE
ncbi:MAG: hypothetical protein ACYTKD_22535, partial [Planctomycetota bacterium]